MSVAQTPTTLLQRLLPVGQTCLRGVQRRHARVHDVRFFNLHAARQNAVIEKYKDKLERKAREVGVKDINELKRVVLQKDQKGASSGSPPSSSPYPPPPPAPRIPDGVSTTQSTGSPKSDTPPGVKPLSSFIDVEKTRALPKKEIEYIWRLRHASNAQSLCAVVPSNLYSRIATTARRHPQFILPLPREGQGVEIHFLQWTFPTPSTATVLFTHLAEYKLRGEYAQPHTTVTHHLELADEKDVVLLEGVVSEGRGVSVEEGKWLLMCLQKFYAGEEQGERGRLLEEFSKGGKGFKVEQLVEEAEKIV